MLVIISDLHLTDGTSGETINAGAFRVFRERLSDLAYDASWRKTKSGPRYEPIESFDLLLLGDILDVIRSTKWLVDENGNPSTVRPWDDSTSQPFIDKIQTITNSILQQNAEALNVLRNLTAGNTISIPPATANGKPANVSRDPDDPRRVPVQVSIHYLAGNHDWFYHLPGPAFNQIRQDIVSAIGLVTPATEPFPHSPDNHSTLRALYEPYGLLARHGDIYDPSNFEDDRNASSLGDAVVVELLNRFPAEVERQMAGQLPRACLNGLKEIDNVRPVLVIPIWLNSLLNRTCRDKQQIQQVKDIWDALVDEFLNLPFVRARDKALNFFDDVDKLEWALKFSKGVSLETISQVVTWIRQKFSGGEITYYKNALQETAFKDKSVRFIVHGHTHHREVVPLDSAFVGGHRLDQMYLNTGTWRRIHELARYAPTEQEFMGYHEMTYFAFFKDNERNGRPFEMWGGTLGV